MKRYLVPLLLAAFAGATTPAAQPDVQKLRLRPRAVVYTDTVRLGDVLLLSGADEHLVQRLENERVAALAQRQRSTCVTHDQVVQRLDELGVNLSQILLSGAWRCQIERQERLPTDPAQSAANTASAPLLRPISRHVDGARTLAEILRTHINAELAELGGEAHVEFERAGAEYLDLTTPPWQFNVTAAGHSGPLGLREYRVVIRRDGKVQRTVQIFVRVGMTREVVVAQRPLSLGNYVRRADITLESRVFGAGDDLGMGQLEEVVGQQVQQFVPVGEMVTGKSIKSVDLVRRSRPVTVVGNGSAVQVRLTGMALDSGGYGEVVRVRVGADRRDRQMLRGVVTGLATVRIAEGSL